MIQITVPREPLPEREYIIDFIFARLLGIRYSISTSSAQKITISLPNSNQLVLEDTFFQEFDRDIHKLSLPSLSFENVYAKNHFLESKNIPVLFGNPVVNLVTKGSAKVIDCGIDIFGFCFFMLSRWEEVISTDRDTHGRFPGKKSAAFRYGFIDRPVVNEYAEFLRNMLRTLGYEDKNTCGYFSIEPHHDVDRVYFPCGPVHCLGDLLRTGRITAPFQRVFCGMRGINYFDTFDWLMDLSENTNTRSEFYFMAAEEGRYRALYRLRDKFLKETIAKIKARGHNINFHPGYETSDDAELWHLERRSFEQELGLMAHGSRQHYLRMSVPETWRILEGEGFTFDSTMTYADISGFRCGTTVGFPVFDLIARRQLVLEERPIVFMDGVFYNPRAGLSCCGKTIDEMLKYKRTCKKYNIPFRFLVHNSSFDPIRWPGWKEMYCRLLSP